MAAQAPTAVASRAPVQETAPAHAASRPVNSLRRWIASTLVSLALHTLLVIVLGLSWLRVEIPSSETWLTLIDPPQLEPIEPESVLPLRIDEVREVPLAVAPTSTAAPRELELLRDLLPLVERSAAPLPTNSAPTTVEVDSSLPATPASIYQASVEGGLASLRSPAGRQSAIAVRGGTPASERAVERALEWFVRHQNTDGSWSFDHRRAACRNQCPDAGILGAAHTGATGLALLCFLGSGHTHRDGPYKKQVQAGLSFLYKQMQNSPGTSNLSGHGSMYSHGLATIALCEAYAMTKDRWLLLPCQRALQFVVESQDFRGGGWRYAPGQPGDTSVVGWQLMALKSGQNAYLQVPAPTLALTTRFLDSVEIDQGAAYLYMDNYPEPRTTTSAIGLLCRMYLGRERSHPGLREGVRRLALAGPSTDDFYFNYYATQVLMHDDSPAWPRWNEQLRESLIATQVQQGHASGSWYQPGGHDRHNEVGGRLYCTALATLTLEVYYRHLPLYGQLDRPEEGTQP